MRADTMGRMADILISTCDEPVVGASLIRLASVKGAPDEFEFGIKHLDGHPVEALEGFRAPRSWFGLGVLTGGWVAPMDGTVVRPSAHPDAVRISQVVLMDRKGRVESRVRYPDGAIMSEVPTMGVVLDALRAALGLPRAA